ncbi:MAG: hypothetical protein JXA52_07490 [Planctomycetes bacterium]|nr:hypothetical protein [Planctomycetota bacterium]
MAKKRSLISQLWWIGMTILGLNFLGLLIFLGTLSIGGKITPEALWQMAYIIRGESVGISVEDNRHYQKLLQREQEEAKLLQQEKGTGKLHLAAREAEVEMAELRQMEEQAIAQRLELEKESNQKLRSEIESLKQEANLALEMLDEEKQKQVVVSQAEQNQRLKKAFANMDPGDIATDLVAIANNDPGYAVRLTELLAPGLLAEVMAEIPTETRQELLPILHNEFADMPPQQVVDTWVGKGLTPKQMRNHLDSMSTTQALQVLRLMERTTRDEVWELVAPVSTETP